MFLKIIKHIKVLAQLIDQLIIGIALIGVGMFISFALAQNDSLFYFLSSGYIFLLFVIIFGKRYYNYLHSI